MTQRINYVHQAPELFKKFVEFGGLVKDSTIEEKIHDLVSIRASQINGCGFCLDMHVKQATIHGERPLRLHHLAIWRESTLFEPRERAALAWTEAVTLVSETHVPDSVFDEARKHFSEQEIVDLTYLASTINAWNRIAISLRAVPGRYKRKAAGA
jgi:AhpD family alkylhydroperoxidase